MDLQASVDRVERELVRLGEHGLDTHSWCRAADALLGRVVGFDGSCWHHRSGHGADHQPPDPEP
jgi:hypothetical protein